MARMPQAQWQGEQAPIQSDGKRLLMTRYDIVCIHTIVGYAPAHAAHFSTKGSGLILQSRDTKYRSGANLNGNHRVIAIENEDHGPRFGGVPKLPEWVPLTPEQVESCAQILAWAHETHGVPLQLCPDSKPGSRGLAYHRQGIDGNFGPGTDYPNPGRVPGGELWTTSPGKVCPTDVRIRQLPAILKRAKEIVNPQVETRIHRTFAVASTPQGHRDDALKGVTHVEQVHQIDRFMDAQGIDFMGCLEYGPLIDRVFKRPNYVRKYRTVMGKPIHIGAGGRRVGNGAVIRDATFGVAHKRHEMVMRNPIYGLPIWLPEMLLVDRQTKAVLSALVAHAPTQRSGQERVRTRVNKRCIKVGLRNRKAGLSTVVLIDKNDGSVTEYLDAGFRVAGHHKIDWVLVMDGDPVAKGTYPHAYKRFTDHEAAVWGRITFKVRHKYPEFARLPKRRNRKS